MVRCWILALALWACVAQAASVVTPSTPGGLLEAVGAAAPGAVIELSAGTFNGKANCGVVVGVTGLTIVGQGQGVTVLDCSNSGGRGMEITATNVTLQALSIQGGTSATEGGNVYASNGARVSPFAFTMREVDVKSGVAGVMSSSSYARGGGVAVAYATNVVMDRVIFTSNVAQATGAEGGALYVYGLNVPNIVVNVSSCVFEDNAAISGATAIPGSGKGAQGGGLRLLASTSPSTFLVESSTFASNSATCTPNCNAFGGAIMAVGQDVAFGSVRNELMVVNSNFIANTAGATQCESLGDCGGVGGAINSLVTTTLSNSVFTANTVTCVCNTSAPYAVQACSAAGAAAFLQGAPVTTTATRFAAGSASCTGNACIASGGALALISASPTTISGSNFAANGATCDGYTCQATGGAVSSLNYAGGVPSVNVTVDVSDTIFNASYVRATRPAAGANPQVYGALGGAYFVQNIVPPGTNGTLTSALTVSGCSHANSTAACVGAKCRAAGGVGYVLTYSGASYLHADGSSFTTANTSCQGDSCEAAFALFDGTLLHGAVSTSPCSIVNNGRPNAWVSLAEYLDFLQDPAVPIDTTACNVALTCPFLSALQWPSGVSCAAFNASCTCS